MAGGSGTRLYPLTKVVSKQLFPVYDKPMIYYPLSVLMLAGIREILVISTPQDCPRFEELLGDGSHLGIHLSYAVQPKPEGLPQAFIIAKEFIGRSGACLALGDNIFYGDGLQEVLRRAVRMDRGGLVFAYWVRNPERYGVVKFDEKSKVVSIVEKPKEPVSNYALTGLYFFDNRVSEIASGLKPSARGELEIVDVMNAYLKLGELRVEVIGRGFAWLDTGTPESLLEACMFIQTIEKRQGLKIACIEEIAYRMGYIDAEQVRRIAEGLNKNDYGKYLLQVIDGSRF